MKKIFKIFIALAFIISILCICTISVSADDILKTDSISSLEATASVDLMLYFEKNDTSYETLYCVDVVWDDISFEFSGGTNIWNPSTHGFDMPNGDPAWVDNKGKITLQNHSNAEIDVLLTFEQAANPNGTVTLLLDNTSFTLANADGNTDATLLTNSCNITAEGIAENSNSVGKITVFLSSSGHTHSWSDGVCTDCGVICSHSFADGICRICGYNTLYVREEKVIYFGEYPQTLKDESVTVGATADSRGYFLGSDNAYYARVVATPYESGYKFSNDTSVTSGTEYYFKVEPLKWRILSESDGMATLICESIIDSLRYDDADNNYMNSEVREWLNGEFYNKAFSNFEKNLIQAVSVDNSAASTGYSENANACENTSDKVYLLSYADVTNSAYGFASDDDRMKIASDFARASGAWISTSNITGYYGTGMWMLRSPNDTYTHFIRECNYNGEVTDGGTPLTSEFYGVVPALKIKL